jgi:hypothetical protein
VPRKHCVNCLQSVGWGSLVVSNGLHVKRYGQSTNGLVVVGACVVVDATVLVNVSGVVEDGISVVVTVGIVGRVEMLVIGEVASVVEDVATNVVSDGVHSLHRAISAGRHFLCSSLK